MSATEINKPLVHRSYLLEKFPGKGGWTYAAIPEILQDKHAHFGWVRVRGSIDGFEIRHYHLMPMGNGTLFLPVRAEIRKKIHKQAGDWVEVILYADDQLVDIPEALLSCFETSPGTEAAFRSLSQGKQKSYIDWIYSSKKEDTQVERIVQLIEQLEQGQ